MALDLQWPCSAPRAAALLTHGAGGNRDSDIVTAVADALLGRGLLVARVDLAFRRRRPSGPPSPSGAAADRAALVDDIAELRATGIAPVIVGGQSYGGRQLSMVAAQSPGLVDGLLLLSYPLHPPGKPERLRTEHFPELTVPTVFVRGSSDTFSSAEELDRAAATIGAQTHIVTIERAGHGLSPTTRPTAARAADAVDRFLLSR